MEKDPEREKRLNEVYKYLRYHRGIENKSMFADALRVQRTGLSAALNGSKANLTDNLFTKICAAYPGVFNLNYLLTGEGSLLADNTEVKTSDNAQPETPHQDKMVNEAMEALKKQVAILEKRIEDKDAIIKMNEKFIRMLEYQLDMERRKSNYSSQPVNLMSGDMIEPNK